MKNTIWLDLMGAEVKYVQGKIYRSRIIEAGHENSEYLILYHGFGGHVETYSRNAMAYAKHFHVVAIELLWHGFTDKPPFQDNLVAQMAEHILDVMDTMGIQSAHLEGEAIGAGVVLWIALNQPNRVNKLILESGGGVAFKPGTVQVPTSAGSEGHRESTFKALSEPTYENVLERLERIIKDPDEITDELIHVRMAHYGRPDVSKAMTEAYERSGKAGPYFQEEELANVKSPTLVIWCDKSTGLGPDAGERIASLIPGAKSLLIPNTSWWGHWQEWEEHNEHVLNFLLG
jgi:pimeloyl-ACP methyl ester carboxylesterase